MRELNPRTKPRKPIRNGVAINNAAITNVALRVFPDLVFTGSKVGPTPVMSCRQEAQNTEESEISFPQSGQIMASLTYEWWLILPQSKSHGGKFFRRAGQITHFSRT